MMLLRDKMILNDLHLAAPCQGQGHHGNCLADHHWECGVLDVEQLLFAADWTLAGTRVCNGCMFTLYIMQQQHCTAVNDLDK